MAARSIGVQVRGEKELAADFARLENAVRGPVLGRAAQAGAMVIETEAKQRAPRKTGTLIRSIHSEITKQDASQAAAAVGTNVEYGSHVEYGTGIHGPTGQPILIRPRRPGGALRFQIGDRVVFARQVRNPGMRPRPFLEPAFDAKQREASEAVAAAVWRQVEAIAKR